MVQHVADKLLEEVEFLTKHGLSSVADELLHHAMTLHRAVGLMQPPAEIDELRRRVDKLDGGVGST
jgi:hypothetical protein